ncbi:hypothetical protein F0Z19_3158 [Vibrio cyclitrophicus]|nr:hypothetical protein M565_ctg1P1874 [Vibrio cyclitrophicus FF75]KAA8598600.1 hypothetical protein F0Z19_3158 [Vibrio cyclitrophicus]
MGYRNNLTVFFEAIPEGCQTYADPTSSMRAHYKAFLFVT